MKTLKLAIVTAILALGFNAANAQVHIGVSLGYPARPVYYRPYYRPVVVERPVYYAPRYPVYRHHGYGYGYYRRPMMYHRMYRGW
jgi:hypothetical protein